MHVKAFTVLSLALAVMGKGNLPKTDNCYYIGRSLPVLQKMCSTPPTQSTCYYDWATSYTGVDPTWIERGKYENKILICDSDEIPGWVKETCRWVDSGNQFLCGKLGEPLLNMRVFASTDYVEVGSLNLIKNVWEDLKDTSEISGINCFSPPTRILMTHGTGCWGSLDAPQSEGNLKVLVRQWGVWGTLERRNNASFPVVLNEREVGGWLKLALWTALEHLKKSPYKVYYECGNQGYAGHSSTGIPCNPLDETCAGRIANGCDFVSQVTGLGNHCPAHCGGTTPCSKSVDGLVVPQSLKAIIYDGDEKQEAYLTINFESKPQAQTCETAERLLTILPGFIPTLPKEFSMWAANTISLDCAIRFHQLPGDSGVHFTGD